MRIKHEKSGLTVPRETIGVTVNPDKTGFIVDPERMGAYTKKLIPGGDVADSYWVWGDGEWVQWGDGEEMEL